MLDNCKIEVDVGTPENTVFIARPWSDDFKENEPLANSIFSAIAKVGLKAIDTKYQKIDSNFIRAITTQIRQAAAVIAVCTPEPNGGRPNSNVMYELGLAHSIGKPTVVISTEGLNAANLQGQDILLYDDDDIKGFDAELAMALTSAIARAKPEGLVDRKSNPDINTVCGGAAGNTNRLSIVIPAIRFSVDVLKIFSVIENTYLAQLERCIQTLSTLSVENDRERLSQSLLETKRVCREYVLTEEHIVARQIKPLIREQARLEQAFERLKTGAMGECVKSIEDQAHGAAEIVKGMSEYMRYFDQLKQTINEEHRSDFMMIDHKDLIAQDLHEGYWSLMLVVDRLTNGARNMLAQILELIDNLGDARD